MRDVSNNNELKLLDSKVYDVWCVGAPAQVVEYALYYDYRYNRNLLSVSFLNVSSRIIKSVYVDVVCYDDAHDVVARHESLPVSGVNAMPEKQFGEDTDLIIGQINTSSVEIKITKVVFDNGDVWRLEGEPVIAKIEEQEKIDGTWELYGQLLRECQGIVDPVYFPLFSDKLWRCTCGTVNENTVEICHDCKVSKDWLIKHFDTGYLIKQNKTYVDTEKAAALAARYEAAKVRNCDYSGYIDAAEKMEALGFYMDAPALAKKYREEAEKISAETELRLKEEIYTAKKSFSKESPEELRAAAAKLDEIAGYKDAKALAEQYRAKAFAIERSLRRSEKQKRNQAKKEAERKARRRKTAMKISGIVLASLLALALVVSLIIFALVPWIEDKKTDNIYESAATYIELGQFTRAIHELEKLKNDDRAKEFIDEISEEIAGFKGADFATTTQYPCYSISEEGIVSFTSSHMFTNGELYIPDVLDDILVVGIADNFVSDSDWVVSVELPRNVTAVSASAFSGCVNLTTVNLHDNVIQIEKSAFSGCTSLKQITLPKGIRTIGANAFQNCTALESITLPSGITSIDDYTFSSCKSLKSVTLEGKINSIGSYAFAYCSSLTEFTIPEGVKTIEGYAFQYCTSLKSISIPDSVNELGSNSFDGCTSLESAVIGSSVTTLKNYCFAGCSKLESIELTGSVSKILYSVFDGCSSLSKVKFGGNESEWIALLGNIGENNGALTSAAVEYAG